MAKEKSTEIIDLSKFKSANLPELQGKKESIAEVIKNNPIKDIVDNASYEDMKKSRTAVKTLRTGLEKESKEVISKLKTIVIDSVKTEYDSLIADVKSAEEERQAKVDVWEEKKEQERLDKLRLEQERVDGIKAKISDYVASWKDAFSFMTFSEIEKTIKNFNESHITFDRTILQEFDVLFDRDVSTLAELLANKILTLKEQEQIRIDNLLIQEKNTEQSRIQEWQRTWNANIDSLSFADISDVKSILVKSKLADLKHYVSGYDEIYLSTEKRLHSQIELISKAEEQRIAQEKFEKERKEFEERQAEVKRKEEEAEKILEDAKLKAKATELIDAALEIEVVADEVVEISNNEIQEVEFEKVISQEMADKYQELFNFFSQEHNLILTITEMDEIINQVGKFHNQFKNQ